jgi:hypothetical protein
METYTGTQDQDQEQKSKTLNLITHVQDRFDTLDTSRAADYCETIDGDHGRDETRKYWVTSDINWLQGKEDWTDL